jgi:hypothetical protein
MAQLTLKERVASLEQQVAELQVTLTNGSRPKDWRRTIGMFGNDEMMQRIFDYALEYREKDRERARRRYAANRKKQ